MIDKFHSLQRRALLATAAAVLTVGIVSPALAQDEAAKDDGGLNEIIVTATKREQNLSDVGVSVTSVGGEELSRSGITDSLSITAAVPNLVNASIFGPGTNTNFSIRGVAQNDFNDGTESPIATYVDDVYLVPTGAGSFPLYDMERVEVLRGPQGTLFGRNSTGGLIHFITAKPGDELYASVSASYGSFNEHIFTGVVNVPMSDMVDLRLSARYQNNSGYVKHITGNQPKGGQLETYSVRGQVMLKPSSALTSLFKFSYEKASGETSRVFHDPVGIDAVTGGQFLLAPDQDFYGTGPGLSTFGLPRVGSPNTSDHGSPQGLKAGRSMTFQNTTNWEITDQITLTSVSAINRYKRNTLEDCDGTQAEVCMSHYNNSARQFTQELRAFGDMGALRWTIGGYYLQQRSSQNLIVPLFFRAVGLAVDVDNKAKGYAAFANIEYDVSPQLTIIAGIRGARDVKSIQQRNGVYLPLSTTAPLAGYETDVPPYSLLGATVFENLYTDANSNGLNRFGRNGWSGKFEIDYKPSDDTLIYASLSRGLKSAGFNNGVLAAGLPITDLRFKPETLLAYEVGIKSSFMDNKASIAAAGFYYDYSNFQVLNFVGIGSFITNRDAKIYGGEVELNFRPVPALTMQLNGGFVDTKLYDVANGGGVVADREMALAPSWTLSGKMRYEIPVGSDLTLGLQVDANMRDRFFNVPGNDPASVIPRYTNVNARIDLVNDDDKYNLGLSVKNVFDKRYITGVFLLQGLGGYRYGFWNAPRTAAVELTVKFR
jgi:iron complex outermembrane recepter protein